MRFGQQLRSSLIKDWYYYYISYDELKQSLKKPYKAEPLPGQPKPEREAWNEDDEKRFVQELDAELEKVFTFQKVKSQEIVRRIKASEKEVNEVVERSKAQSAEGGQVDEDVEEDFMLLEEDLSDMIADVHDLARFTQLNYTGFQKIIKKHDKQTSWHLKPVFAARLRAKPFYRDNYDSFIIKLSSLYDLVRTRGNPIKGDAAAGEKQQNFVRQTTKYWVHPENLTELKLIIMKHLPVLVFNPNKEFEMQDTAITSIYYDNPDTWELYTGRLKKTEGAEAIRMRWYGGMSSDTIFVERKTHREDWTGEKSVKARFATKEKNINAYLSGQMSTGQIFEKMRKDGKKSEKEIDDLERLAQEIQYRVIKQKYVPVTRTFYHRTAFQLPGDARVRISLDTELTMVREDNLDGKTRAGKNWRRMDIGVDWPFSQLPPEDVERFPYGVLEVKLQTQAGQEPPEWIRELCASHLVEAVPKFSKFIHGTASLNPNRIHLLPFWMPQMDVDIRKPVSHHFGIEHPGQSTSVSTSNDLDDDSDDENEAMLGGHGGFASGENEDIRRLRAARDAMEQHDMERTQDEVEAHANGAANGAATGNSLDIEERIAAQAHEDYPIYDSDDEEDDLEEARRVGGWSYYVKLSKHHVQNAGDGIATFFKAITPMPRATEFQPAGPRMGVPKNTGMVKKFKAPEGKRIHVPVRVEPKVHFAAERTFLSWLEFSIILGSIAATLLNFGDTLSLTSAWAFTILACIALFYSMGLYLWRTDMIKKRRAVTYYDRWGPSVLCVGLLIAVGLTFGLRLGNPDVDLGGGLKGGNRG